MAKKKVPPSNMKPGSTKTKIITRGPNKGDKVKFKGAKGGKPFPVAVINDKGNDSTLKPSIRKKGKKSK